MDVSLFDFDLPEERIALRPAEPRDSARMMVVREDGDVAHARIRDLPNFLRRGDLVVVNDSKVVRSRVTSIDSSDHAYTASTPKVSAAARVDDLARSTSHTVPSRHRPPSSVNCSIGNGSCAPSAGR